MTDPTTSADEIPPDADDGGHAEAPGIPTDAQERMGAEGDDDADG